MFRVYDTKEKRWVKSFYIMPNEDMFMFRKTLFRRKLVSMPEDRYVLHRDINIYDSKGILIFEGDIVRNINNQEQVGVVAYAPEHASYYVFNEKDSIYYVLNEDRFNCEIIGNVFDTPEYVEQQKDA